MLSLTSYIIIIIIIIIADETNAKTGRSELHHIYRAEPDLTTFIIYYSAETSEQSFHR